MQIIKKMVLAKRIADLTSVKNKNPHHKAAKKYNHLRVEMEDRSEHHLLFTDFQIKRAIQRAEKNPEDLPKIGWLLDILETKVKESNRLGDMNKVINKNKLPAAAKKYNHIRVSFNGCELHMLFTCHEIKLAMQRAKKNPEDLVKVSWIRDILD
jgi:hypothetical protein